MSTRIFGSEMSSYVYIPMFPLVWTSVWKFLTGFKNKVRHLHPVKLSGMFSETVEAMC